MPDKVQGATNEEDSNARYLLLGCIGLALLGFHIIHGGYKNTCVRCEGNGRHGSKGAWASGLFS